jgi:hypothetical protein
MNDLEFTVPLPGNRCAVLTVPGPLTADTLHRVEQELDQRLGSLRRDLTGGGADEGAREYESWMQQLRRASS